MKPCPLLNRMTVLDKSSYITIYTYVGNIDTVLSLAAVELLATASVERRP